MTQKTYTRTELTLTHQPVVHSGSQRVTFRTVHNVRHPNDPHAHHTMRHGHVFYGRNKVSVYYSSVTQRWCNF